MAPTLTRSDGSALRVLVVDDEPSIAELPQMALRYEGWDVTTAGTGRRAVAAVREHGPDVVVLDMMLAHPWLLAARADPVPDRPGRGR